MYKRTSFLHPVKNILGVCGGWPIFCSASPHKKFLGVILQTFSHCRRILKENGCKQWLFSGHSSVRFRSHHTVVWPEIVNIFVTGCYSSAPLILNLICTNNQPSEMFYGRDSYTLTLFIFACGFEKCIKQLFSIRQTLIKTSCCCLALRFGTSYHPDYMGYIKGNEHLLRDPL